MRTPPSRNGSKPLIVIQPETGWRPIEIRELVRYRELLYFLARRDIKVRYKQTLLGGLWAIIQPVVTMIVFSVLFGRMANIPSDGIPYPIFVYAGLLPWTYFANALTASGNSLVGSANLVTKVWFPRLIIPFAASIAGLVDFLIAMVVLFILMIGYRCLPGIGILLFPVLVLMTVACAVGAGLWLAALNVQYRDIRHVIPFLVQCWMFISPVIYPVSLIHPSYRWVLALNPMTGIIDAFRSCLLGHRSIDLVTLTISGGIAAILIISGLYYFRRMEKNFADVI